MKPAVADPAARRPKGPRIARNVRSGEHAAESRRPQRRRPTACAAFRADMATGLAAMANRRVPCGPAHGTPAFAPPRHATELRHDHGTA